MVTLNQVSVHYNQIPILSEVSLCLRSGQIITLLGPNGAGKTTLVRLVLNLMKPDQGSIERQPGLRIGYVPQKLPIDATLPLTVGRFLRLKPQVSSWQLTPALERVGAEHLLHRPLSQLSGGELQRVALARALLSQPQLLVLDEPTQGVDILGQAALYQLIKELRDESGCAVLLVSHDLHLVMASTDEVICLNKHICCHGAPKTVSTHPAFLAMFGYPQERQQLAFYRHQHQDHHD
ncbi:MAG: zinc ABC transporter ATP-binding protein ZnuC [Candidatus Symbiodolus clandestinus]